MGVCLAWPTSKVGTSHKVRHLAVRPMLTMLLRNAFLVVDNAPIHHAAHHRGITTVDEFVQHCHHNES